MLCDKTTVCTNDPLSITIPNIVHANLPICLFIDPKDGPTINRLPTGMVGSEVVFDASKIQDDINCATFRWNCVCGKQNSPCDDPNACLVTLQWSKKSSDFDSPYYVAQANSRAHINSTTGECNFDCSISDITLNNSGSASGKMIDGYPQFSIVNYDCDYYKREPKKGYNTYNLCYILLHEIGHLMGLNHFDKYHCNSTDEFLEPTWTGKMYSYMRPNALSNDLELTDYDKCAVAKLHCPTLTDIDQNNLSEDLTIKSFPSPAFSYLNLEFNTLNDAVEANFQLFDIFGNILIEKNYSCQRAGINHINIDLTQMDVGFYFYKINVENTILSDKIIVAR
jgi:hypothetical protein